MHLWNKNAVLAMNQRPKKTDPFVFPIVITAFTSAGHQSEIPGERNKLQPASVESRRCETSNFADAPAGLEVATLFAAIRSRDNVIVAAIMPAIHLI